ncbi:MAG: hypothetical protein MUF54_06155 [Polyangiaceae bacterium]|nr:hypothetical protein [Polyangiaceae bacterium]
MASPSAGSTPKVCGKECRERRNRKLARKRRRARLAEYREDEGAESLDGGPGICRAEGFRAASRARLGR